MIGCGSIGQAVLPLLLRELALTPDRLTIVTADQRGRESPIGWASGSSYWH
jgi:homospermidine synthase